LKQIEDETIYQSAETRHPAQRRPILYAMPTEFNLRQGQERLAKGADIIVHSTTHSALDARLELHLADHADLEAEVAQCTQRSFSIAMALDCSSLRWVSSIRSF
jgi:hypothetical protein